jgi:hypothetical protein
MKLLSNIFEMIVGNNELAKELMNSVLDVSSLCKGHRMVGKT